ncbi:cytochrome P450 protein [Rutstroemia sp. NJR-2017a BVV2]|nr:cytochrome P450 protein [Rutstroemia sp. NJR-2017a BVV2]
MALITILALPVALLIWTAQTLAYNRDKAKATGLPYLERWISPINPFWLLYGSSFVRLCERLGIATENLSRIYSYGWEANQRAKIHEDYGDAFLVVHPGGLQLCVSNAEIIYDILRRRTDFRRNMEEMAVLNVYGKNLSTTDDQEWQQHRKMTSVTFTEKNNELVWQQSLLQAEGMLKYWTERASQPIRSTGQDTKVLTLNVLAAALFNKVYPFEGQAEEVPYGKPHDDSYEYRSSLSTILGSIIQIFIFGEQGLTAWWVPKSWQAAASAMSTFRSYIFGLMEEERRYIAEGKENNQHLVARLVNACEEDQVEGNLNNDSTEKGDLSRKMTLTREEILSNLFVYAFAGNDTTSIALTNILIHLAANPKTQDWIAEEINHYFNESDVGIWNYNTYSKLKRCSAVVVGTGTLEAESLLPDTSDNFMPFAWGQRVCPGKKFAQVELVAVLARLFGKWTVVPDPENGETLEQARNRAWKSSLIVDHQGHMLHEMVNPESVALKWVERETREKHTLDTSTS